MKANGFIAIYLPVSFLLLQCATLALAPSIAGPVVTVSIGAATAMLDGAADPERLIEAADRALYKAKCAGLGQEHSTALRAYSCRSDAPATWFSIHWMMTSATCRLFLSCMNMWLFP